MEEVLQKFETKRTLAVRIIKRQFKLITHKIKKEGLENWTRAGLECKRDRENTE